MHLYCVRFLPLMSHSGDREGWDAAGALGEEGGLGRGGGRAGSVQYFGRGKERLESPRPHGLTQALIVCA